MMSFDIGELHPNSPHLFADLAELLLFVGHNGRNRLHTNDLENLLVSSAINSDEIDDEADADQAEASSAERNSRQDRQIEDVMTQLAYRGGAFGSNYPFFLNGDVLELVPSLSEEQRVYRLLLACSRLRSFGRGGIPQRWAKVFAELGKVAVRGLMPEGSEVRIFDANSSDRREYYGTDLRRALRVLGRDLGVLNVLEAECDRMGSSGDAGLDLVATLRFEDGASASHALLGQCGAQETGWPSKTLEAHPINFRHVFQMQLDYQSIMFTPVCYRLATGEWVDNKCTNGVLVADPARILRLVAQQRRFSEIVATQWFLDFETEFARFSGTA